MIKLSDEIVRIAGCIKKTEELKSSREELKPSRELINKINKLEMSSELKNLINKFIEKNKNDKGLANIGFRANLHYLIDNIKKENKLINVLKNIL